MTKRRHVHRDPVELQATKNVVREHFNVTVRDALQRLPVEEAHTVLTLGMAPLGAREASVLLGVPVQTVKKRWDSALSRLRSSYYQRSFDRLDEQMEVLKAYLDDCDLTETLTGGRASQITAVGRDCVLCGARYSLDGEVWKRGWPRMYCTNACRQHAYRLRQQNRIPAFAKSPERTGTTSQGGSGSGSNRRKSNGYGVVRGEG
ncbi:ferredoxin [Nocardia sp. GAS34]|uniref:hypothetical protein n=1 Tax=unclassified Nocardia TaxID=2637762 RepID=UPI003D196705